MRFGFAADSPDIPHLLDLPVASIEWDGMQLSYDENSTYTVPKTQEMHTVL
jgi:hypothetical protein